MEGNTPTKIKDEWDAAYGDFAPSFITVKFWAAEFNVAVPAWEMKNNQDVSKLQPLMKHHSSLPNGAGKPSN